MADIELVIKIPQDFYEFIKDHGTIAYGQRTLLFEAIINGTPLKIGHWIGIDEEPHEDYECDRCGYTISVWTANIEPHTEYKYCPNCGAKMESEE